MELNSQFAEWQLAGYTDLGTGRWVELDAFSKALRLTDPFALNLAVMTHTLPRVEKTKVLGFAFSEFWRVALETKFVRTNRSRPLVTIDGVGGDVLPGEGFVAAQRRHFKAKAGVDFAGWKLAGIVHGVEWRTFILTATSMDFNMVPTVKDSTVRLHPIGSVKTYAAIPELDDNVPVLVSLCGLVEKTADPFFTLRY